MNLLEEIDKLNKGSQHDEDGYVHDPLLWSKMEIWREMVRRIEALEQREHSHPLGVGSLARRG